MSDRLQEIRARLDAATPGLWVRHPSEPWVYVRRGPFTLNIIATQLRSGRPGDTDLIAHAPADIAWLLDEVERLERENADDLLEITRKASDAEDYWMQEAKRLAAEVERLRNTKVSVAQPLCDESVAQDVTNLECSDG